MSDSNTNEAIQVILGIAIDVSQSMKEPLNSFDRNVTAEGRRSISKLREILNAISKHLYDRGTRNISSKYFGVAFGLSDTTQCGDLLHMMNFTTKRIQVSRNLLVRKYGSEPTPIECLNLLIGVLEEAGARTVRSYAEKHLSPGLAKYILPFLTDRVLVEKIVQALPASCKSIVLNGGYQALTFQHPLLDFFLPGLTLVQPMVSNREEETAKKLIQDSIQDVEAIINESPLLSEMKHKPFISSELQIMSSTKMEEILGEWDHILGDDRDDGDVDPTGLLNSKIYGRTPMYEAMEKMLQMFRMIPAPHPNNIEKRILFLVSDGYPTDNCPDDVRLIANSLKNAGVVIISCYLSTNSKVPSKELFYSYNPLWDDEGARLMFDISSPLKNTAPGLKLLIDQGWKLPNEGIHKLFFQGNNTNNVETFVKFVKNLHSGAGHGCLLDVITRADLDIIIGNEISNFQPVLQEGGTCYAHAIAAVFYLAMKRIKDRDGGHPEFHDIKNRLITQYGVDGAGTQLVLQTWCPRYRLQFRVLETEAEARQAINARRPVVARFGLSDSQWRLFRAFYKQDRLRKGVLKRADITPTSPIRNEPLEGHAVVLMDILPDRLTFLNSWGDTFGDGGFFHVEDSKVLNMTFFDVYWTLNDLTAGEKHRYEQSTR
jgi:hypothetical protein